MQIYNTMSRKKEQFVSVRAGEVYMYACGITAYDLCHIGHARSAVVFDVLARYLRFSGYKVHFVRNFTDVDDKIINKANLEGISSEAVAEKYIHTFHEDMDKLAVLRADSEPRATDYIQDMLNICKILIEKGHAYATEAGDVYFRVRSYPAYGKLSGRDIDDLRSGARVAVGEIKEDPLDFALWKSAKANEPYWESPYGKGRPGWHIECSAMTKQNLPLPLDIHGGGQDLIFPHHENEIAQTEAAFDTEFARYWVHNGFVQIDSEKMSKSLNNFKTIRDILQDRQPEVLRFFLLGKHYRSPIDFSFDSLEESERGLKRIYETYFEVQSALNNENWKNSPFAPEFMSEARSNAEAVITAMEDDLNTAAALGHVFAFVRLVNRMLDDKKMAKSVEAKEFLELFMSSLYSWKDIFGLFMQNPEDFLLENRDLAAKRKGINLEDVTRLLADRQEARATKDFVKSDQVRDELLALGVEVRDSIKGQAWQVLN